MQGWMASTLKLLNICREIELKFAQIYRAYAAAHAEDPTIAQLWLKTSKEEEQHALQYQIAPRLLESMVAGPVIKPERLYSLQRFTDRLLATSQHTVQPVNEALQTSIELEQIFAEVHLVSAFSFTSASHRRMFQALLQADRHHIKALRDALARRTRAGS